MTDIVLHPSDHKNEHDWHKLFEFLDEALHGEKIQSVLDLGGGTGNLINYFLSKDNSVRSTIVDTNKDLLQGVLSRHKNSEALHHDINKPLPFGDDSFDFVSCTGTLHYYYIEDPRKVLEEMKRVSRKYIFVDFFLKNSPYSFLQSIRYPHFNARKYTRAQIKEIIENLGLNIVAYRGARTVIPFVQHSGKEVFYLLEK